MEVCVTDRVAGKIKGMRRFVCSLLGSFELLTPVSMIYLKARSSCLNKQR